MPASEPHDDFVVLTGSHVVSPSRQLMIQFGRLDLEMNGVQEVAVYFDPELRPDGLMMLESQSPYYITPSDPAAVVPLIPFSSKGRQRVFDFGFTSRVESATLIFLLNYDERSAHLMLRALSRLPPHVSRDRPAELMKLILGGIARLRHWPIRELSGGASIESIELRLNHKFVSTIEHEIGLGLSPFDLGEVLLASWHV
jgi:hypothetical protein